MWNERDLTDARREESENVRTLAGMDSIASAVSAQEAPDDTDDEVAVVRAQMHYAVEKGDEALLREVCSRAPAAFDLSDDDGWAVLHWCGRYGRAALALVALQGGAAPDARTLSNEHTPLHVAAMQGNVDVVLTLLHFSADLSARDTERRTALHWAAVGGHAALVSPLVRAAETHGGADGWDNLRDTVDSAGRVALHLAAAAGKLGTLGWWLQPVS